MMHGVDGAQVAAAAIYLVTAATWGVIAYGYGRLAMTPGVRRVHGALFVPTWAAGLVALRYLLGAVLYLVPLYVHAAEPAWLLWIWDAHEIVLVVAIAGFVDLSSQGRAWPSSAARTRWRWRSYGAAALVCGASLTIDMWAGEAWWERRGAASTVTWAYLIVATVVILKEGSRRARPGAWQPYGLRGLLNRDVGLIFGALLLTLLVPVLIYGRQDNLPLEAAMASIPALAFALVLAMPALGWFLHRLGTLVVATLSTAVLYLGIGELVRHFPAEMPGVQALLTILGLLMVVPIVDISRRGIDGALLRRSRQHRDSLSSIVADLDPRLGSTACCQAALDDLLRAMPHYSGAAILLDADGVVQAGGIAVDQLERVWPRGREGDRLADLVDALTLEGLPPEVALALGDAGVVAILPIRSHHRHWGHLLLCTGLLGTAAASEDRDGLRSFAGQLGLVLEGTDLLGRARALEESLEHTQRLAEVGQSTARLAHEIRNPVAAARSLAQLLASDPRSDNREEHEVILSELDRIERRVSGLLRYARREEAERERVDLAALVRDAAAGLRGRLHEAGVQIAIEAPEPVHANVDREKIRQVLVNLLQNAAEALHDQDGERRVAVQLSSQEGMASLRVRDNGPGLGPGEAAMVFEPFFTKKADGTGLGLAISRKSVESHGGRIEVESVAGEGCTFHIRLPAA